MFTRVMHIQRMANRHQRGITNASIGTAIENPNIDDALIAKGMAAICSPGRAALI